MKYLLLALALLSSSAFAAQRYQVISAHPHDLEHINGKVKTVYQNGRLWIVEASELSAEAKKILKPISGDEKSYFPPVLKSRNSNSQVQELTEKVSETFIRETVARLSAYKTRVVGSKDNQKAVDEIEKNFSELGYATSRTCHVASSCSVVAEKVGTVPGVILVMAHIDSVGKDFAGADDNASGTAVLLEMARVLSTYKNQKTLRFFTTNGEESGLLGAKNYAKELQKSGAIKDIHLAINMDMVGYNSNSVVELETNAPYETLAKWFAELATTYTSLKTKITIGAWGSDHVPFLDAKVPTMLTIENWATKTPCYHLACDKPDTLNYGYATEIGKLNVAAVVVKDLE